LVIWRSKEAETINYRTLKLKKMDFLMKEYLDQQKIGNVHVEDIRESDIGALYVRDAELR